MDDNKNQIIPLFNSRHGLDFDLKENLSSHLNLSSARRTFNAWQTGAFTDPIGRVWIDEEYLSNIWRTDQSTAAFFVGGMRQGDRENFSGKQYVKYSAVIYRLNEILQGPVSNKRREYLRLSEIIGGCARDASQAEVLRLQNTESVNDSKRRLKTDRIRAHGIHFDELTGKPLDVASCEFHHIRRQSGHTDLIGMIWNGLIINISTHRLITANNISDENHLYEFCIQQFWSTAWFAPYKNYLNTHYFGNL